MPKRIFVSSVTLDGRAKPVRAKQSAKKKSADEGGPEVLRFEARLVRLEGAAKNDAWVLEIPKAVATKLRGMNRIEGIINGHPFRAPLEGSQSGRLLLRVNQAMRKGAGAGDGDAVALAILGPEPDPAAPPDLQTAFRECGAAKALWTELTSEVRLDWVRWINGTKNPATRARRITRTVEQLAEGKRRPCCVNFYEYMLQRVRE